MCPVTSTPRWEDRGGGPCTGRGTYRLGGRAPKGDTDTQSCASRSRFRQRQDRSRATDYERTRKMGRGYIGRMHRRARGSSVLRSRALGVCCLLSQSVPCARAPASSLPSQIRKPLPSASRDAFPAVGPRHPRSPTRAGTRSALPSRVALEP
ncbi:hypothetical protein C8Q73DRAFT_140880 [Cubamyces lactineus]|nr:hypothetical protein C8Q73DRAFT_140880 [Cubamyces lactineus]